MDCEFFSIVCFQCRKKAQEFNLFRPLKEDVAVFAVSRSAHLWLIAFVLLSFLFIAEQAQRHNSWQLIHYFIIADHLKHKRRLSILYSFEC